ncbi:hypothetical protein XENOCAPTIV_011162, partial [Xenoophorus captivus]
LLYHSSEEAHSITELSGTRQLRGAFSDTEEFLDHGLVSANRCSSRTSSISSWTENIKPSFTKKLKFQSVLEGEPVELKCKLIACPLPTILWFHNNRSILKERRRRICTDSRMHMHTTCLVIDSIREKDSGSYKVMALNSEGSAESTASLLVSLREEQSANYLGFVRRSAKAHESVDSLAEQRKERKFRVDLRCVGSPFDKMSKVHQGRSRSKSVLVRTVYFRSSTGSLDKQSEKESKRLETASERALSPRPMFDRSEHFNDRFSDIYCDRHTGARFSDKFSDRCSDRYSDRFSDTESLHNEVRVKLTTLQKAVKQKKRLSISTMSSSEFEVESVASESSYAEYVERLRVKPASLSDVQHQPLDQGEKPSGREPSQPQTRHSFEPQSRTRAIQIMKGELVDTTVPQGERKSGDKFTETLEDKKAVESQADVRFQPMVSEHHKVETPKTKVELQHKSRETRTSVQKEALLFNEEVISEVPETSEGDESYEGESLRVQYGKSLEAERKECEDKLLALRIRKWQQGSLSEQEKTLQEMDVTLPAEKHYMEPTGHSYIQQEVMEKRSTEGTEGTASAFHKSPTLKPRPLDAEAATPKSPKTKVREVEVEKFPSFDPVKPGDKPEESLRDQYEKSLEAERMECEEKLLALRISKWQQCVRMSEEEAFHPETDLPLPGDNQYMKPKEHINSQQEVVEKGAPVDTVGLPNPNPKTQTVRGRAGHEETSTSSPKARMKTQVKQQETEVPVLANKSPKIKAKAKLEEVQSPRTKVRLEKKLFEKTKEERELQLSRENISELKSESEKFGSEEEALTQRIMKWQQDVLMEQQQAVELESGWAERYPLLQAEMTPEVPEVGRTIPETSAVPTFQQPAMAHSRRISPGQTAEEKLLTGSASAGSQDQKGDIPQWPPAEELPTEGRETRLQTDSEYFVSEEEAMAQRILKWQQDVVEQEEVAELESEWASDNQCKQSGPALVPHLPQVDQELHHGSSPALPNARLSAVQQAAEPPEVAAPVAPEKAPLPYQPLLPSDDVGGAAEWTMSREHYALTSDKSRHQRFQTYVRDKKGVKEEVGTAGENSGWRQQKGLAGTKKDERGEESVKLQGIVAGSSSQAAIKKEVKHQESQRVKQSSPGSCPVFLKEISSLKVKTGEMTEFTSQFQGDPLPAVNWFKDGHPVAHNPDYDIVSKSNNSKLAVFYPTTDHEGTYDCVITNKHGKSICSATLEISDKKVSKKTGVTQEVVVTEELEGQESLLEQEIQTYIDSGKATLQVPQTVVHKRRLSDDSFTSSPVEIRITAATPLPEMPEDSSEDRPQALPEKAPEVASDDGASQTLKHKFTFSFDVVGEVPCVVTELENVTCSEGSTAVLECVITGHPVPEATWYFNDTCLDIMAGKYRAEVDKKVYRLFIYGFRCKDAGKYKCLAKNKLGEITSICYVSGQLRKPVQFSERGEAVEGEDITSFGRVREIPGELTEDIKKPAISHTEDKSVISHPPSNMGVKAPKSRFASSKEPPALSGCGLQGSAAIIKVSQIKQAFQSDSPVALMTPPSPEEQRKDTQFPEEFIPAVAISLDPQEEEEAPRLENVYEEPAKSINPYVLSTTEAVVPESSQASGIEQGAGIMESHDAVKQFVEELQESPELVRPRPQKLVYLQDHLQTGEVEMVREHSQQLVDRTSSFIPFKPEKDPVTKCSVRAPAEECVAPKTICGRLETDSQFPPQDVGLEAYVCLDAAAFVEALVEGETHMDEMVTGLEEGLVLEEVNEEAVMIGEQLVSLPEPSMDSGIFVSMPDPKTDATDVSEKTLTGDKAILKIKGEMDRTGLHLNPDPNKLIRNPNMDNPVKLPDISAEAAQQEQVGDALEEALAAEAEGGAAAAGSMEEEEVTFGAVYEYYNPPTDWGRPLTPESEMSIEIGSTVSEEIAEVPERFYTPGSSTEVSQPIAESLHTLKSPPSFHTPGSDIRSGFMTPDEFPFSSVQHKRPSTGDSTEKFFSPVQFLNSPADEGVKTDPNGVSLDENRFISHSKGLLGPATLQEKVQGIPPAFLKPLIKKRVFENDSLTFYAEVFGLPSPEVRWFFNKTQLVADDRVRMDRDGDNITLVIHDVTKADQGEYICEAVNYVGEARSVALVVVVSQEVRFMPAPPAVTHQHVMEFDVEENDSSRSPSPQEILLEVELDENEVKEFEKQVKIITIPEYTADNKSMVISLDVLPSIYEEGAVDFVTQDHDDLKIAFEVTEMPPRFINPICDMETPEGTTVMFECSLMGIPSPIVSWFKGDKKISHNTKKYLHSSDGDNHFLKICKVTTQDSGAYTCRAINLVGETLCRASLVVISAKAFSGKTRGRELTAVSLGSAKVQPQKFDLMVGNTSFDGEQVSEIELEFEFEQETDESQRALRLVANTDHQTSEQGQKYVSVNFDVFAEPAKDEKIEFKGKSSEMCSFHFQVTEMSPKCVIPLTNATAAVGTPVILQCLVSGKPNPTAQWYKDGELVSDSRCIIQEKSAGHFNLLITNVIQSDAGEYNVAQYFPTERSSTTITTVEEREETFYTGVQLPQTSKTLELKPEPKRYSSTLEKKKEKPVFLSQLSPAAVTSGETARFTVRVSGFPRPIVQWTHNGRVIKSSSVYRLMEEKEEYTLVITKVTSEYEGEYSCTATNRFGQTACTTYLEVKKPEISQAERWVEKMFKVTGQPPTFTVQIQPVRCSEGGEVYFNYKATGDPVPDVKWFKGAFQIQPSRNCILVANPDGSGLISIKSIKQEDSGLYTCKASNQFGEATCSAELVVFRESVSHKEEQLTMVQKKAYKVSVSEQATESRLYQVSFPGQDKTRSDQMVYTIGTEDRKIIPSEQVGSLGEVDISAATIHRETVTQQAAVLQTHEIEERVSVVPHPPQASAVPGKQLHMAAFTSSVEESQGLTEQHCDRIQSPEVIELQLAREKRSKLMSAVAEELTPLSTVSTELLHDTQPVKVKPTSEPKHLVSGHQVEAQLSIMREQSDVIPGQQQEKGYRVKEGVKILYSAQSAEKQALEEAHTADLPTAESAIKSTIKKEQRRPILALVSESKHILSKETELSVQTPAEEAAQLSKDKIMNAALNAEERQILQAEPTLELPSLDSAVTIQSQVESGKVLHLQVITDQDLLSSEKTFSCEKPAPEEADTRKSPTLLHTVSQDEQRTVFCEDLSEFEAKASSIVIQSQKEAPAVLHLQSAHPVEVLPKEGLLTVEKPDQQVATQKHEKSRSHAAISEERRELTADYHAELDLSVTGVQSKFRTEPKPQNILQVSYQPMQLPKETPITVDFKHQRALVQKEDRWNVMHVTSVADSRVLEEGHTQTLSGVDTFKCLTAVEPKMPTEPVQIEEKEISTESSISLEAAEQDFAVQIQEGQSVRQSIVMDEKHVLTGEHSQEISKSKSSKVVVSTQPKLSFMASESKDSTALPKEMIFVIQIPKPSSLNIRRQLREALQSAVARDQPVLLADVVGRLQAVEVQEVKVQREPKRCMFTYLITTTGAPMEITLAFEGEYPQTADLRTELQAAFHSIVYQEAHVLTSESPGTMELDKPHRAQVTSSRSEEMLSTMVETVPVAESTMDFTAVKSQAAALKIESNLTVECAAAEGQIVVQECKTAKVETSISSKTKITTEAQTAFEQSVQVSRKEMRSVVVESKEKDAGAAFVSSAPPPATIPTEQTLDVSIQQEHREEIFKEEITVSRPEHREYPEIVISLQDLSIEEDSEVTFRTTIKFATKISWFFNGQLVKSGKEFKCFRDHDTYSLVINKVVKERHQGEYVCEAENEAGRTTTSSRLTVVPRGLLTGEIYVPFVHSPIHFL